MSTELIDTLVKSGVNGGVYAVMCLYLLHLLRGVLEKFFDRLIAAIQENTAAQLKITQEQVRLSEKVDALGRVLTGKDTKT